MQTNGGWTAEYVRSNEVQDVFRVTGPGMDKFEYRGRNECSEEDILNDMVACAPPENQLL